MIRVQGLDHITITVSDVARSLRFYTETLGLECGPEWPGEITMVGAAPARVLWYVSNSRRYPGSQAIRACSQIDEVVIDGPKDLFRRFRRLGVYDWESVFALAKGDIEKEVMAFRFSKTEQFGRPVPWDELQQVLRKHGRRSNVQSPVEITEECFLDLYRRGIGAERA